MHSRHLVALAASFAVTVLCAGSSTLSASDCIVAFARDTRPDPATIATRFGDTLMQRSRDRLDPSLYEPAAAAYKRALSADPQRVPAMLGLAWARNSQHDFAEGCRWAEAALAIDPDLPDAFALLGDAEVERGDYEAAFDHFQRALDLRPDLSSYSRAAHLLWLTGDADRGRELMRMAIAAGGTAPENTAWCRAQLALMHFHAGDLDSAQAILNDALRGAPDNVHLLVAAGRVRAARGEHDAAIAALRRSVEISPTHDALAALADLHAATGRDAGERSQVDAVVAFHREHAAASHTHARPHAHVAKEPEHAHAASHASAQLALFLADHDRELESALAEAQAAYEAFPNVFAAEALAWCQFKTGRLEDAAATIREALRWNTPVADLHFHAGMIFAKLGDTAAARAHLERALAINPAFHPRHAAVAAQKLARLKSA
jgi:tetratricopeptide (TPR) repeat protein